jgi:hypothetical protein
MRQRYIWSRRLYAPGPRDVVARKPVLLAATPGFDDHIAIRQLSPNAHRATLRVVLVPAIVMPAIIMSMNHDIVAIMDNDLRGRRNSAQKTAAPRTTNFISASSFAFPGSGNA